MDVELRLVAQAVTVVVEIGIVSDTVTMGAEGVTRRYDLELTPERPELIVYDLNVELQSGEIIEEGDHDSLIAQDGQYAHLFKLQAKGYRVSGCRVGNGRRSRCREPSCARMPIS